MAGAGGGGGAGCAGANMGGGTRVALAQRKVGLDSFKIVRVIGKGSFGKVRSAAWWFSVFTSSVEWMPGPNEE